MVTTVFAPRILFLGFLSWLVPFLAAFAFFTHDGGLAVRVELFKSLMVVIGALVGVALLVAAFRRVRPSPAIGLAVGLSWMAVNLVLDLLILVPMSGRSIDDYVIDIGLRYLVLPVMATGMGLVGQRAAER